MGIFLVLQEFTVINHITILDKHFDLMMMMMMMDDEGCVCVFIYSIYLSYSI